MLAIGYLYAHFASDAALASIGLLSFAAIAQILPAFLGGLIWRRGTARGAAAGMIVGSVLWLYLLFLPSLAMRRRACRCSGDRTARRLLAASRRARFVQRVPSCWRRRPFARRQSAGLRAGLADTRRINPLERTQGAVFVGVDAIGKPQAFRLWRASATVGDLEATVARYLGAQRARKAFEAFYHERGDRPGASEEADALLIRHAEHLLAPAIGATTSRLVLSLLLRRRAMSSKSALKILDDASAAIQSSRDQLQYALDHARQGITVFDANLALTTWNREFAELFDLPASIMRVGVGLDEIVQFNASRGIYGPGSSDDFVAERIASLLNDDEPIRLRIFPAQRVIEIRSARLPDGGIVTTYTDVTQTVAAEEQLAAANERLERRVQERTTELEQLNSELERAKILAEQANISKTRFLAAAGHDVLQPLNAARLYVSSLNELASDANPDERASLTRNVDASLEAVEDILSALLDMSRLDAGVTKPEIGDVRIQDLFRQLEIEFGPLAKSKGLKLKFVGTAATARTDRRLMRRLLQNFISNAIKYTLKGGVVVGCRRVDSKTRIEIWDTGLGVPEDKQRAIFDEFLRLDQGARTARGLGLGLSIVQRLGRVLNHPIDVRSRPGTGSVFSVTAPTGSSVGALSFKFLAFCHAARRGVFVGSESCRDRQRTASSGRHDAPARTMGLRSGRHSRSDRRFANPGGAARYHHRGLSPRRWRRPRGDRRDPDPFPGPYSRHSRDGGSQRGSERRGAVPRRRNSEQADQAGPAARADDTLPCARRACALGQYPNEENRLSPSLRAQRSNPCRRASLSPGVDCFAALAMTVMDLGGQWP